MSFGCPCSVSLSVRLPWMRVVRRLHGGARGAGIAGFAARVIAFLALSLLALSLGSWGPSRALASPEQPRTTMTYELAETWSDVQRDAVGGRYVAPLDISSSPDGTVYVLDTPRLDRDTKGADPTEPALSAVTADGSSAGLYPLGPDVAVGARLDVASDSVVHVLGVLDGSDGPWGVVRVSPRGVVVGRFELLTAGRPADIAVAPDGRIYVSMASVDGGPDQIDVYDEAGDLLDSIVPGAMGPDGPDERFTYDLMKLDVAADGTVYVIAVATRYCPPAGPQPPHPPPPPPTPTPRPSLYGGGAAPDQDAGDLPCRKEIVLIFESDHSFREEVPNEHTADIAVGPSGVFVSTDEPRRRTGQKIYELGAERATFTYRVPQRLEIPASIAASHMQLDVAPDGSVHAVTNLGAPFYRGALTFGHPSRSTSPGTGPESALGFYDVPVLGGPNNPRRIDAADVVTLLEEPYQRAKTGQPPRTVFDRMHDASAIQRWTLRGEPVGQSVHHGDLLRDNAEGIDRTRTSAPIVDVAYDGSETYILSPQYLWHRPDDLPPDWYRRVGGAHFLAVAADDGKVAVLNGAAGRVLVANSRGRVLYDRPLAADMTGRLAGDLALDGDVMYITDQGRNRVLVRHIDGREMAEWPTHDGPERITVAPNGHVVVLGRGGTGLEYTPQGELVAAWHMPEEVGGVPVEAQDIAAGDDGRVYVSFVGLSQSAEEPSGDWRLSYDIDAAGVWVFAPLESPPAPGDVPDREVCEATVDKTSYPPLILLGETVDVTLKVDGVCPGEHQPHQLVIVLDTSWSMHDNYFLDQSGPGALTRAKELLTELLASLEPGTVEVGLVTFSGGAGIDVPLPGDPAHVRQRILSRIADGDTRMGVGVALAHEQLIGAAARPDAKHTILIVTDGVFKDDPGPALAAARADGIEIVTVVLTTPEFDGTARTRLETVLGPGATLFIDPPLASAGKVFQAVSSYIPNPRLFERLTITDVLPTDMEYVTASASPPGAFDASSGTLSWDLGAVAADDDLEFTYRVRPRRTGHRNTNVRADAVYVDALGNAGAMTFPVPNVYVLSPDPLPTSTSTPVPTATPRPIYRVYLPLAVKEPECVDKTVRADIVLAIDMSTSMYRLTSAGRTKHEAALGAARAFVDQLQLEPDELGGHDQVAIVGFNSSAWTAADLTSDRGRLAGALDALMLDIREGTRLDLAFAQARRVLSGPSRVSDNTQAIVLLTDGLPNRVPTPAPIGGQEDTVLDEARKAKEAGALVFTIGLGQPGDVLDWMLEAAASDPTMYYRAPDGEDLAEIYQRILRRIVCE